MARKTTPRRGAHNPPRRGRGLSDPRPRQAGNKPWADLSEDYRKRLITAHAKGKDLTAARGHGPKAGKREHVSRRERELAEGETTYQRSQLKLYAARVAASDEHFKADKVYRDLRKAVRDHGWEAFVELRDERNVLARGKQPYRHRAPRGKKRRRVVDLAAKISQGERERKQNNARMARLTKKYGLPKGYLNYHPPGVRIAVAA